MDDFRNFYQNKQNRQTEGASNTTQRAQTEFPKDTKGQMDYLKRLAGYYSEAGATKGAGKTHRCGYQKFSKKVFAAT